MDKRRYNIIDRLTSFAKSISESSKMPGTVIIEENGKIYSSEAVISLGLLKEHLKTSRPTVAEFIPDQNFLLYYNNETSQEKSHLNMEAYMITGYEFYGNVVICKKNGKEDKTDEHDHQND